MRWPARNDFLNKSSAISRPGALVGVGAPLALGLLHVALVAPHYQVGSFDDDSSYILTAKALLAGHGLNGHLTSGEVISGLYPPGYGALLAPLVWLWPHSFAPLRLLSVLCFAALFPLTWVYLRRRGVSPLWRTAALTLMALGPPLASFASMVMAETPYLVLFMVLLLLVDRWDQQPRAWTSTGAGVVLVCGGLVWLKQAGVGVVAGLLIWLVVHRRPQWLRRALTVIAGAGALLVPVVIARLDAGIPLAGSRYSSELGTYYHGGLVSRLVHVLPHSAWHLLSTAIPATLIPYLDPLPLSGRWSDFWIGVSWQVTAFTALGAVVWQRRHRDAAMALVLTYLGESVLWPEVNERRAILVVPVLAAWYVLGLGTAWQLVARRTGHLRRDAVVAGLLVVAAVAVPLVAQMPRHYLYGWNQTGSQFGGSRYAAILARSGAASDVVETGYTSSTALFTGHRTANTAFVDTISECDQGTVTSAIAADRAAYLLVGALNKPGHLDGLCLLYQALTGRWAVPLLHSVRDDAFVYELVGPGTGHPDLVNLDAGIPASTEVTASQTTVEYRWLRVRSVTQVSVGEAAPAHGAATVRIDLRRPDGSWVTVGQANTAVGDGAPTPFLLPRLPPRVAATAVRVVVTGRQSGVPASVGDVAVLGPSDPTTSG